jgi:signal peptidase I
VLSWVVSIILAFIIVKFIIYPLLGLILGTGFPIVAVVSESMEHKASCYNSECSEYKICGKKVENKGYYHLEKYFETCGEWYKDMNIGYKDFKEFSLKKGFNKGDVIILIGAKAKNIKMGDVVVFDGNLNYPIIHRAVKVWDENGTYYFQTKGDNNGDSSSNELKISEDKLIGKAVVRLPLLGWIKIMFSSILEKFVR